MITFICFFGVPGYLRFALRNFGKVKLNRKGLRLANVTLWKFNFLH